MFFLYLLLNPGIILLNSGKKVEMLGVSTLFYYICSKFLKKCSILRDCMELTKRLKEQKSNN
ncbi:Uncharacterised protein [Segatella copri]|nr:Uncharacterised protein [Segatella copri]